ncbi:MAG: stage II sporulation protein P [Ruminococcus sp.]
MRKRFSRRAAKKRRRKLIALCTALTIAAVCIFVSVKRGGTEDSVILSDDMNTNACNEVYMAMQTEKWVPVSEKVSETIPAKEEKTQEEDKSDAGEKPYPEKWNENEGTEIIRTTLGGYSGKKFVTLENGGMVANCTDTPNDVLLEESVLKPAFKISVNEKPQVLIMHTHTTETYEPYVRDCFDPSFNYRTTDSSKNVIAVGEAIAEKLRDAGIVTIHDETIHDYPSYTGAYERSAETVKAILEEYPSIKAVLDIHRDAIGTDTSITQPIAEINGKEAAQVMIISGCDDGTMDMPDYMFNFRFACRLQEQMEIMYPGLARPVLFDYRRYNQNLTKGSLLIEVGSHGNTLEQALYSGSLVGEALSEVLLELH